MFWTIHCHISYENANKMAKIAWSYPTWSTSQLLDLSCFEHSVLYSDPYLFYFLFFFFLLVFRPLFNSMLIIPLSFSLAKHDKASESERKHKWITYWKNVIWSDVMNLAQCTTEKPCYVKNCVLENLIPPECFEMLSPPLKGQPHHPHPRTNAHSHSLTLTWIQIILSPQVVLEDAYIIGRFVSAWSVATLPSRGE